MSCMFPQFIYQLRLDSIVTLRPYDLSSPPHSIPASGNCLSRSTPLFFLLCLQNLSHLIPQPSSLPAALSRTYTHLSLEIPGPRQKAGAAYELKPLSIPLVTSGNLRDSVFVPGSLGLIRNNRFGQRDVLVLSDLTAGWKQCQPGASPCP